MDEKPDRSPQRRSWWRHPERVVLALGLVSLLSTWGLGLAGLFTGNRVFYGWASFALLVTLAIASTPLVVFLIGVMIEKLRGDRHAGRPTHY